MTPIITAMMAAAALAPATDYDFVSDNLAYTIVSDTEAIVSGFVGEECPATLLVPAAARHERVQYKVIGIGPYAFYGLDDEALQKMIVSEGIREIGYRGVACSAVKSVRLPSSLVEIGEEAFWQSEMLAEVEGSQYVETLGPGAFRGCNGLTSIELGDRLGELPTSAFEGCRSLTSVSLPGAMERVGDRAFAECTALEYVTLPDGLRSIGAHCFSQCRELRYLNLPGDLEELGAYALSGCNSIVEQEWPEGLAVLQEGVMSTCKGLEFAYIGPGVREVEAGTYQGCDALEAITIAPSVERIGSRAFADCPALKYVYVDNLLPPTLQPSTFDPRTYSEAVLYVWPQVVELYRQSAQWSKFEHVLATKTFPEHSGVEAISAEGRMRLATGGIALADGFGSWVIYALDGAKVAAGNDGATIATLPGIYIVRWADGAVAKVNCH